jgi:sugar phosphate isomerase/epimerase
MSLPIAVQVYSVRDNANADLYATLKQIKEFGYDGVEFAGLYGNKPADIKAWCEEIGLVPVSAHVPYVDMLKDPIGVLSAYAEIGCKYVAVPYLMPEHRPDNANFPYVVEFIGIIGGSLIVEQIFGIPGVGGLYLASITALDYNVYLLLNSFYTLVGLTSGIVVDLSYGFVDPRIRMGER